MRLVYQFLIKAALILVLLTGVNNLQAQDRYGDIWVAGLSPIIAKAYLGDFPNTAILPITDSNIINRTSACISDANGNLQFYTNGAQVLMPDGRVMENGFGLNPDALYISISGVSCTQGALILPSLENKNQYTIFHYSIDTNVSIQNFAMYGTTKLYYTVVDMSENMGKGKVISKNNIFLSDVLLDNSRMTACKHANGRDWWLVKTSLYKGEYYKFLYTSQGIEGPFIQEIGDDFGPHYEGQAVFSNDGTKFATVNHIGPCVVMDFNRCTGEFSRPFTIKNLIEGQTTAYGGTSLSFSPSGRFLYINTILSLNQYDLWNSKHDSIRLFTNGDRVGDPVDPGHWLMSTSQLAPNGKIYLATWNGGIPAFHIIHQPDSLGFGCQFVAFGQPVNTVNAMTLPNMPNYRLGKLVGSPCDTLVSDIKSMEVLSTGISVYPNPAANTVSISIAENQPGLKLFVTDINGSIVHSQAIYSETAVDISKWAAGFYFVRIESNGKLMAMRKFVKE
ncbi:MAG: T9SS type A sorting domain-containing protein [Chitinophagales bacterium]|nr:T9SS type A sorting domain-containing protein [Chitinophagales bacterium]